MIFVILFMTPMKSLGDAVIPQGFQKPAFLREAPDFRLRDLDGKRRGLADYRGKVILLHFWATWCEPCKKEIPALKRLYEGYHERGLVVNAVAADNEKAVRPFVKTYDVRFPVLIDQYGSALRSYRVRGLPSSYLIGRSGKVAGSVTGPVDWERPDVLAFLEGLLRDVIPEDGR